MNTKSKIALGVLGAVAAGVVIGLLMAPEKGTETRKKIRKTAGGWVDSLGHLFTEGKHEVDAMINKVRHGKAAAEEKVNQIKENLV